MALTDTAVRQAKPADKDYSLTDGQGLSLFVSKRGGKSWHFRFMWAGKQNRISLGTYPEISLKDARRMRDDNRELVAKGIDPREQRDEEARAQVDRRFETVANEWYEFRAPRLTVGRQGAQAQAGRYLKKDILPVLGNKDIGEITRADVLAVVQRLERRGALSLADKARTWLRHIFRYAMAHGLIDTNPASDLDILAAPKPPVRHNPILTRDELPEFLRTLRSYPGSPISRAGVRLLLLTGVRTQELRYAAPQDFDLEAGLWRVPPDSVKQLRSRLRTESGEIPPYIVPLSRQAIAEVREMLKVSARYPYLLAGRNDPTKPISENTLNKAIKSMGYEGRLTGHGLRGTVSTALHELGYESAWIEAQLSHADPNKTRASYNHAEYVEQRAGMMQAWADLLDELEAKGGE